MASLEGSAIINDKSRKKHSFQRAALLETRPLQRFDDESSSGPDPVVDLAAEPRTIGGPRWLLRNDEPLPPGDKRYHIDE
jgi:hypothetical protein